MKRSLDPVHGKNRRDRELRRKRRDKFLRGLHLLETKPAEGVLPSFERNFEAGSRTAVLIPADDLNTLVRKWVRGVHYKTLGHVIPAGSDIGVYHVHEDVADTALSEIESRAPRYLRGPGIDILQAVGTDLTGSTTLYRFLIWQQFKVYASVEERGSHPAL